MRLLLDSHTLLWAVSSPEQLAQQARDRIGSGDSVVFVSLASLWELRIKETIGKLSLPDRFYQQLGPAGYEILAITLAHIGAYGTLPLLHRDPFDRMLVAQAKIEELTLVTRDPQIARYGVPTMSA